MSKDRDELLSERITILNELASVNSLRTSLIGRLSLIDNALSALRLTAPPKTKSDKTLEPLQSDPFNHENEQVFLFYDQNTGDGLRVGKNEEGTIIIEACEGPKAIGWQSLALSLLGNGINTTVTEIWGAPAKKARPPVHMTAVLDRETSKEFGLPIFTHVHESVRVIFKFHGVTNVIIFRRPSGDVLIQLSDDKSKVQTVLPVSENQGKFTTQ